ncbi:MAG: glycosyltransferase [Pseudoxanthomonas sp.]
MSRRVVMLTAVLPDTFGGRTKSLLQRGRIFSLRGERVFIYSINHDDNYQDIFKLYRKKKYVLNGMVVGNMFEDMAGFDASTRGNVESYLKFILGDVGSWSISNQERARVYSNASKGIISVVYSDDGMSVIKHIEMRESDDSLVHARVFVNNRQNVTRVRHMDGRTGSVEYDDYLDANSRPYMRHKNKNGKKLFAYLGRDGEQSEFRSLKCVIADFLDGFVRDDDVIINDDRGVDYSVRLLGKPVRKIYVMHNPHLADPLDLESGLKKSFRSIIREEGLQPNETIISLTEDQRDSIVSKFPALSGNIVVIGHTNHKVPVVQDKEKRTTFHRIGIVSRLEEQKNLSDAIAAFDIFRNKYPDYVLDIYGKGSEEEKLRELVGSLGIQDCVNFMGFTDNVNAAFQSVDFTLNTSFFEGFPLAIIESISNGTPVASYPVNFGPKAILGGVAGRISTERSPHALALVMEELAGANLDRKTIQEWSNRFSEDDFYRKWTRVMNG